jgi:hypothetical protein
VNYVSGKLQPRKRGMRDVAIVMAAAALIMIPSYVGRVELDRLKVPISIVAVTSLGLFLVGVFLLTKVLKD